MTSSSLTAAGEVVEISAVVVISFVVELVVACVVFNFFLGNGVLTGFLGLSGFRVGDDFCLGGDVGDDVVEVSLAFSLKPSKFLTKF